MTNEYSDEFITEISDAWAEIASVAPAEMTETDFWQWFVPRAIPIVESKLPKTYWHRNASGGGSGHKTLEDALVAQIRHRESEHEFRIESPPTPPSVGVYAQSIFPERKIPE